MRLPLLPVDRSALHRRALAPIHHLSVKNQSGASREIGTQLHERKEEGEKMENFHRARCGHRLQEFQIMLEMHKKNRTFSKKKKKWFG